MIIIIDSDYDDGDDDVDDDDDNDDDDDDDDDCGGGGGDGGGGGVTTVQKYRVKTTCGSQTKIPKKKKKGNSETKATNQKASTASADTSSNCPECIKTLDIPANFRSAVCNASAVYKGLAGRKRFHSLKLNQDLRPKKKLSGLRLFASYQLPPGCSCPLLSPDGQY
ncbi:alpha-2-macroglobulin-like protein [Plakobranchus ocellatus]|uniref:Alpha-2-macroglobulin-like protein n=1 Tax=Plakobranchus ocellatus TaxID=259542 RepID=A0AAV3Z623_9GAST|nr:alpha-2-macroglobulin-like protein [Plakobranchus ocellatus]